jgi:WD40 repeat protein
VRVWDLADRAAPVAGRSIAYSSHAVFHPATGLLAVDNAEPFSASAFLWDLTDPGRPRQLAEVSGAGEGSLADLDFSADGATLAVVTSRNADGSVRIFDLTDRGDPRPIEEPADRGASGGVSYSTSDETYIRAQKVHSVTFLPGRSVAAVVAGDDNTLTLWDYTDPTRPRRTGQPVAGTSGLNKTVAVLPDGSRALTGRADGTVPVWDLTDTGAPHPAGRPITAPGAVTALTFRDDHTVLVGRGDGSATAWDLTDPDAPRPAGMLLRSSDGTGHQVAFGPRGAVVAVTVNGRGTVVGGKTITLDKVEISAAADPGRHGNIVQPLFPGRGGSGGIGTMVSSPSGDLLAVPVTSWGTYVTLWDVTDPARARRLGDHLEPRDIGDAVAFSPDGRMLAYTQGFGARPAAVLMDIGNPAAPRRIADPLTGHTDDVRSLAFAPDSRVLATGSADRSVILWDVADPARPTRLGRPLTGPDEAVAHMSFSPDGRVLVAAAGDGTIFLWNVEDPAQPVLLGLPITAGQGSINAIALSPDGTTLVVGDPQGTVILWDLAGLHDLIDHPAELACARTGRGLDHAEWDRYIDGLPYQDIC